MVNLTIDGRACSVPEGATILLAGKGHEDYQIIGKEKHHFDEKEIVTETFKLILK